MKLLIDNAISPVVAKGLADAEYDVVHVRELGMAASADEEILEKALELGRIVVSADTDFGTLLALRQYAKPSFILMRQAANHRPEAQLQVLLANLPQLVESLELVGLQV